MLIAFCGCDGAGKSTQIKRIYKWLELEGYEVAIIDKWDILDVDRFPECRFIKTKLEDLRVCIAEMEGISRAMFLFWSISITLKNHDLNNPNIFYLLDGYWMKHGAAEIEYGCAPAWIKTSAKCLPQPDITFYFDVTPEEALKRKTELTPYECGRNTALDAQDFIAHQTKVRQRMNRWSEDFGWLKISSLQDENSVTKKVQGCIRKLCQIGDSY